MQSKCIVASFASASSAEPTALAPERAREMEGERRHVLAEHDFVGPAIQEIREGFARSGNERVGFFARGIAPVRVRVVVEQVVVHRVDDGTRHLRSAGSVEVGDGVAVVHALERGKMRANALDGRDERGTVTKHRRHAISTPAHCSINFTIST